MGGRGRTFHLLFEGEAAVDPLELRLHRQPADVGLQVRPVHHADPEHDQGDVLRLRGHQAALPLRLRHAAAILLILEHHSARGLRRAPNPFVSRQTRGAEPRKRGEGAAPTPCGLSSLRSPDSSRSCPHRNESLNVPAFSLGHPESRTESEVRIPRGHSV